MAPISGSNGEHDACVESLLEDIQKNFVPTDDFPRDFAGENELIMNERASLLIASALNGGRFAPLVREGEHGEGWWHQSQNVYGWILYAPLIL